MCDGHRSILPAVLLSCVMSRKGDGSMRCGDAAGRGSTRADAASDTSAAAAAALRRLQLRLMGLLKQSGSLATQGRAARLEAYLQVAGQVPNAHRLRLLAVVSSALLGLYHSLYCSSHTNHHIHVRGSCSLLKLSSCCLGNTVIVQHGIRQIQSVPGMTTGFYLAFILIASVGWQHSASKH